jgi:hypothetical protein
MGFAGASTLAAAVIALLLRGIDEQGVGFANVSAARVAFIFFWLAYVSGSLAALLGTRFVALARHRREFGLAFAAALFVHLILVGWLFRIAAQQPLSDAWIAYFAIGAVCVYALALGSARQFRDITTTRAWRLFSAIALNYVAFLFFRDFVLLPLLDGTRIPLSGLPFAVLSVAGPLLRLAAGLRRWSTT